MNLIHHSQLKMIYKYFTEAELACSHCNKQGINEQFMLKIESLREQLGFPFIVTSGYRCEQHPIEARKTAAGAHTTGSLWREGLQAHLRRSQGRVHGGWC